MKKNKNIVSKKIGSRILTDEEVKLILPTYERIKQQIEDIRIENINYLELVKNLKDDKVENIQKTNNIGILGARGTGKTSVMKTLIKYLQQQDKEENGNKDKMKNIILPLIIPENMSESMNLMSTVLGLFKKEVDKIEGDYKNNHSKCWEQKKHSVVKKYNDIVRKYCYIQSEYRQVTIGQYTTENDYVKKSSEIFNSDIEFVECFNDFIETLLNEECYCDDALVFLFIDDIDLSTHRCTDVVKTLLSYISNPRIVTFLSGDLNTFEEALTIDFLRQENVIYGNFAEKNFLHNEKNETLLDRKKNLAYEYLKKVIPPLYRHSVKNWTLNDRGNYTIISSKSENNFDEPMKLSYLLTETFKDYNCECLFQYYDYTSVSEENQEPKLKSIPQVFHLFDSTSRGLNNIYNSLLEVREVLNKENTNNSHFIAIKLFLETIVASNPNLSRQREFLLEKIIQFGSSFEDTIIRCDNFINSVYENYKEIFELDGYIIKQPETRFQLFVFLELSLRLLKQTYQFDKSTYKEIKQLAILDLINYPQISESTINVEKLSLFQFREYTKPLYIDGKSHEERTLLQIMYVLIGFLRLSSFTNAICYYQYISKMGYDFISRLHVSIKKNRLDSLYNRVGSKNTFRDISLDLYYVFKSSSIICNKDVSSLMSNELDIFRNQFMLFISLLGGDSNSNIVESIFGSEVMYEQRVLKIMKLDECIDEIIEDCYYRLKINYTKRDVQRIKKYIVRLYYNYINSICSGIVFSDGKVNPIKLYGDKYINLVGKEDHKPFKAIIAIDKNELWNHEFSKNVKKYIIRNIVKYSENNEYSSISVNIQSIKQIYDDFCKIKKGSSNTKARKLMNYLNTLDINNNIDIEEFICLLILVEDLAFSRAWYGVQEALRMHQALQKSVLVIFNNYQNNILRIWLHCYARYKIIDSELESIYKGSYCMSEFLESIYSAFQGDNQQYIDDFKTALEKDLGKEFVEEIDDIFKI